MTRASAGILVVLAFASGLASGVVVAGARPRDPFDVPTWHEKLDAIGRECGLDERQKKQILEVSEKFHERFTKLNKSPEGEHVEVDRLALRKEARAAMRTLLNEEQAKRFDALLARYDESRKKAAE